MEKEFDRKENSLANQDIVSVKGRLSERIAQMEARLTIWILIFSIAQVIIISGILLYFKSKGH